jgi:nucleotide-binding universal stress UspA family protein
MIAESDKKLRLLIDVDALPAKRPIFVTLVGFPPDQILALAARENVDLIVMGMHNATGTASHWPFEVFSHIVARAVCPVLSVRA